MGRGWPPVSVWLAAVGVAVPPAVLFGRLVFGKGLDPAALAGGLLGLPVAAGLLSGWRGGWWLAALGLGWVAVGVAGGVGAVARDPHPAGLVMLAGSGSWVVTVGGLLWWPETRRWCGLLPARREDDEP